MEWSWWCSSRISDCWRPFFYVLSGQLDVMLVKSSDVRAMPRRKSDVSDAEWLPTWPRTGWSDPLSYHPRTSATAGPDSVEDRPGLGSDPGSPTVGEAARVESVWGAVS